MSAMIDATCPKCGKRFGWMGTMSNKPACPKCGFREPQEELNRAERELDDFEELLLGRGEQAEDQKKTLTLLLQAVVVELLNVAPSTQVELAAQFLRTQQVPFVSRVLKATIDDMVAKSKVCPKCERRWPEDQLLMKCVSCEQVFCPACKDLPNVHRFECPVWQRKHSHS